MNFETSTTNSVGLTVTPSNPSGGIEKEEVTGTYSGSISSSQVTTALGYTPVSPTVTSLVDLTTAAGGAFGTAAYDNTGTSGATIPLLNGSPTASGVWTFSASGALVLSAMTGTSCLEEISGIVTATGVACGSGGGGGTNVEINGGSALVTASFSNNTGAGEIDFTNPSGATVNATLHNTTISGISLGNNLDVLTFGTHLTAGGASYNGSANVTITSDATNANTASTIVARDASGNFSAGTITATLNGNATSATTATSATNFTGSLSGDVTGTQSATSVVKINGGSMPGSANVLGSNSSSQPISASAANIVAAIGSTAVTNATNAVVSTNLAGGALGSAPYQNAANTTLFIASPTTSGHTFVYAWQPSGSIIAPTALDLATWYGGLTINATQINGATVPASALFAGTNSSHQIVTATTANLATFLSGLTGCGTAGYPYVPADSKCEASGTGTVTDGVGTTVTPEFAETTSATHVIQYVTPSQALTDIGGAPAVACTTVSSLAPANGRCYDFPLRPRLPCHRLARFDLYCQHGQRSDSDVHRDTLTSDAGCSSYLSGTTLALTGNQSMVVKSDGTNIWASCTVTSAGTINNAAQYDVPYYSASGTTNTMSGTAISGFQFDTTGAAPTAATAAQLGGLMNIAANTIVKSAGTSSAPVASLLSDMARQQPIPERAEFQRLRSRPQAPALAMFNSARELLRVPHRATQSCFTCLPVSRLTVWCCRAHSLQEATLSCPARRLTHLSAHGRLVEVAVTLSPVRTPRWQ